jgi:hypothetical protein
MADALIYTNNDVDKYLKLQWINYSDNGEYIGFKDGRALPNTTEINNATTYNNTAQIIKHYDEFVYLK